MARKTSHDADLAVKKTQVLDKFGELAAKCGESLDITKLTEAQKWVLMATWLDKVRDHLAKPTSAVTLNLDFASLGDMIREQREQGRREAELNRKLIAIGGSKTDRIVDIPVENGAGAANTVSAEPVNEGHNRPIDAKCCQSDSAAQRVPLADLPAHTIGVEGGCGQAGAYTSSLSPSRETKSDFPKE